MHHPSHVGHVATIAGRTAGTPPSRERGFTLAELIVTASLFALVAVIAVPSGLESLRIYKRSAAVRSLLADIRATQHLAITRRGTYALQWGADSAANRSASEARIIRDTTGSCGLPAVGTAQDDTTVIRGWYDIASEFPGTVIESVRDSGGTLLGGVMFDSRGSSVNTCATVSFPVYVTVADPSGKRVIEIERAGGTRLQ